MEQAREIKGRTKSFLKTLTWILIGISLGVGFIIPAIWWVGILAVSSFLLKVRYIASYKEALGAGFLVGLFSNLLVFSWVWSTYPIDWIEVGLVWQIFFITIYWLLTASAIALSTAFFALAFWWLSHKKEWLGIVIAPFVWLGSEILGSFLFALVMYAPEGGIQAKLSFGYVGYLLAEHGWFIMFAKWGGVYVLSFLFISISSLLALAFVYIKSYRLIVLMGCILGITATTSYTYTLTIPDTTVAKNLLVVETDFSRQLVGELSREDIQFALYQKLFRTVPLEGVDAIVFPEGSNLFSYYPNLLLAKTQWSNLLPENHNLQLIDTSVVDTEDGKLLRSYQFDNVTNKLSFQDKSYLVPQGEFWSYWFSTLAKLAVGKEQADKLKNRFSYIASDRSRVTEDTYPILACFASADPLAVRNLTKTDSSMPVIHPISHGWFHDSSILERQQNNMLQVQSVWSGRVIVGSANQAASMVYFPNGALSPVRALADEVYTHIPALTVMRLPL